MISCFIFTIDFDVITFHFEIDFLDYTCIDLLEVTRYYSVKMTCHVRDMNFWETLSETNNYSCLIPTHTIEPKIFGALVQPCI